MIAEALLVTIAQQTTPFELFLQIANLVDITPDVSLLAKVGQSGHSVADAVAELVDNALDAQVGLEPVRVDVVYDVRDGWIEVSDDGKGMSRSELAEALVLGLSHKGAGKIGRFGLGLKTACTSLGSAFQVRTAPADGKVEWVADYDEDDFLTTGKWELPIRRQARERERGTSIFIYSSRVYNGLSRSLFRNLGSTFRHFIDDGVLLLTVNGEAVRSVHLEIDTDSVLPIEGEVCGYRVKGWAGLLLVSSQRGWYGFSLVRNRRVIRRHEKLGFRAHPSSARVVGELHLDEFPVNNLKTDFIRETDAWRTLEQWVSSSIEPVLSVSRALAHAGSFDNVARSAITAERERILAALGPDELVMPSGSSTSTNRSSAINIVLGTTHLTHRFESAGTERPHFRLETVAREHEQNLLAVYTNADHPGMTATDPSQFACHNLSEAAALATGDLETFIDVKSHLLSVLLNQKDVRRAMRTSSKEWSRAFDTGPDGDDRADEVFATST